MDEHGPHLDGVPDVATAKREARVIREDAREARDEERSEAKVVARAGSRERWQAGMVSIIRWVLGSSTVGSLGALPSLAFDRSGQAGATIWFLTALVGLYGSLRSQRAAGRKADLLAEAEGIRARIEAESGADRAALVEARRLHDECESRYSDLVLRFGKLESQHEAMEGKIDLIRSDFDRERREHMASMREETRDAIRAINETLRRDHPGGGS